MNTGGLIIVILSTLSAAGTFIWLVYRLEKINLNKPNVKGPHPGVWSQAAKDDVEHIFNDEFREELRNRGRLHFEKIINDNAMFLQQDLRQTTAQLNEYMQSEITRVLQEEFKKYEQSIADAKQMALDSINKTISTIEQQRSFLEKQLETQAQAQKSEILKRFETDMARIVNHYLIRAIGSQIDISDQLDYIMAEMENRKKEILEDINRGI